MLRVFSPSMLRLHTLVQKIKLETFFSPPALKALQSENIFAHLIEPYDSGESLPSPGFSYRLQRLGLDEFPNAQVGSVYLWAQDLCGLYYPSCQSDEKGSDLLQPVKVDKAICQSKVFVSFSLYFFQESWITSNKICLKACVKMMYIQYLSIMYQNFWH